MQKKIPMRQCLGCREMKPKRELTRVVRTPEGTVCIDRKGKANGRGAYLCPSRDCLARAQKARRLERALADFALDPEENPLTAARAERQRIALASVVALGPRLLVLDEPTTGLSFAECRRTMEIVRRLHREGTTVVLISHDMELILRYAERMLVLAGGTLRADGAPHDVLRRADVLEAAALLPPEIVQVASALGEPFAGLDTDAELARALIEARASAAG